MDRPTGGLAGALLFFFLNLNPHQGKSFREHIREFDFVGLFVIVIGVVCLLIGFNSSETTCNVTLLLSRTVAYWCSGQSAETIALLVVGGALLILGGVNEIFTKRSPIIPPRLFKVCVLKVIRILSHLLLDTYYRLGVSFCLLACYSVLRRYVRYVIMSQIVIIIHMLASGS